MPTENPATIRDQAAGDALLLRAVHSAAFARGEEADLVEALHREGVVLLSLVARSNTEVVGHVLFTRIWIDSTGRSLAAVALAPVAVLPTHQRRGIGSELIRLGLSRLRERGEHIAVVLGDPKYYSRFGFSAGKASALKNSFPADYFMALELVPGALDGVRGAVRYPTAFAR